MMLLTAAFTSCKKKNSDSSTIDLYKDSVYMYAKEEYLWYDALPDQATFNPRRFTGSTEVDALQSEVDAISQYKINSATNLPYEYNASSPGSSKYSYIDGGQASASVGGAGSDMGFSVFYQAYNDLRIKYVYPGSPAAVAGLVRGYKVTAVNNSTSIAYDPNASNTNNDPNLTFVVNALGSNTIKLTLQRPDATTFTVDVARGNYTINPVLKYSVITSTTGKVVGYFAFNRFTSLTNSKAKIDEAFSYFASQNISELVVDLRYNGGGDIETAAYLSNYMVPSSKNGTLMFTEYYNARLQNDDYPLLKRKYKINAGDFKPQNNTTNFAKMGNLNLSRAFFLVTGATASASELLINNLRPVMTIQLIGRTTYGKPVGFFGIPVGNYDMYLAEIESRNANGQADYYQGMVPATNSFPGFVVNDDITKDFGDKTESLLARALNYIDKGNYSIVSLGTFSTASTTSDSQLKGLTDKFNQNEFNGMIVSKLTPLK